MKKILLLSIITVLGLSGCNLNGHYKNEWFPKEKLEECNVPNLPKINVDLYFIDYFSRVNFNMEYENFEKYAKEVYAYLESLNFEYFGTQGEQKDTLAGAFTSYYYKKVNTFEECKNNYDGKYYVFVYSDGDFDENKNIVFNEITLYRGTYSVNYKRQQYEFNSMIKLSSDASYFFEE